MIRSIEAGTQHKASAELAMHTTDVIFAMDESGEQHKEIEIKTRAIKPEGLWKTPETILWK